MRKAHGSNIMVQESCSNVFYRKITVAWKKEWAHSVGLGGRLGPVVGDAGKSFWLGVPRDPWAGSALPLRLPCGRQAQRVSIHMSCSREWVISFQILGKGSFVLDRK